MAVSETDTLDEQPREELVAEVRRLRADGASLVERRPPAAPGNRAASDHFEELGAERAMRVEAERIGRVKDDFLANLSHEIRTPLNAILGWSQLLHPGKSTDEEMAEGLEVIQRNARDQVRLIDDLLDMSRIISGKLRLDVQRVELPSIIQSAVAAVQLAADAKGVRLETILDPIAGPVTGDPNRMRQVVWNLLSNAIKFTPRGGKVQITLERANSHIELSVSDTGIGIGPRFLPHVFERFSQADLTATRNNPGLGLGLAIVKNLVEMHGGSVRAKSAGEGKGATFIVSLPVSVLRTLDGDDGHQHPATAREVELPCDPDLSGVRALVVDDDGDALYLVAKVLKSCNAEVTSCSSAAACMEILPKLKPDVLLADIGMPGTDGYVLIQQVRNLRPEQGRDTPAIAVTAYARSEDRRRAMLMGFDMHLAKPVEPGELVAVVARLSRAGR